MIPIRCFTCGKVIAQKWTKYNDHVNSGQTKSKALDNVGLKRYCCRRMFLTCVDLIDKQLDYCNNED